MQPMQATYLLQTCPYGGAHHKENEVQPKSQFSNVRFDHLAALADKCTLTAYIRQFTNCTAAGCPKSSFGEREEGKKEGFAANVFLLQLRERVWFAQCRKLDKDERLKRATHFRAFCPRFATLAAHFRGAQQENVGQNAGIRQTWFKVQIYNASLATEMIFWPHQFILLLRGFPHFKCDLRREKKY